MATAAPIPLQNGTNSMNGTNGLHHPIPTSQPLQLSLPLPHSPPNSRIHLHLTILPTSILLFVTTSLSASTSSSGLSNMGSFVYAIPNRHHPSLPLTTPLYTHASTLDLATRLARTLARRLRLAVHVGCSAVFSGAANSVEEETEAFVAVVGAVLRAVESGGGGVEGRAAASGGVGTVNGDTGT